MAAIVATYINIGAYWTYIELASVGSEATPEWVGKVLVWTSFCSILGCAFTLVVSNRFGLARPLLVASILAAGLGYKGVFTMCAIASLTGMSIYLYMYIRVRKTIPALAGAT